MAENFVFKQTGAELQAIIDAVETIDQTPTEGSKNPVESGGVAAALEGVETALEGVDDALEGVDGRLDGVDARLDDVDTALAGKQATLVSGTNIKTINGESVLGAGDLRVGDANAVKNLAGSGSAYTTVIKAGNSDAMTAEVRMVDGSVKAQAAGGSVEVNAGGVVLLAGNSGAPNAKVTYNGNEIATKGDVSAVSAQVAAVSVVANAAAPQATTYTKTEVDAALAGKQATISDLETIRTGAAAGETAVQPAAMQTALAAKADKATTLAGYGITDAYTKTEVDAELATKADKADTYTKEEIGHLIVPSSTTIQVVETLPAAGSANTIYRVPGTDSYTDYGWDGTQFVPLATYDGNLNNAVMVTPQVFTERQKGTALENLGLEQGAGAMKTVEDEDGFYITDAQGNVGAQVVDGKIDALGLGDNLSEIVVNSVKEGIANVLPAEVEEEGFFIADAQGNVGMKVVNGVLDALEIGDNIKSALGEQEVEVNIDMESETATITTPFGSSQLRRSIRWSAGDGNPVMNFAGAYLLDGGQTLVNSEGDNIAPISFGKYGNLGGNHGMISTKVLCSSVGYGVIGVPFSVNGQTVYVVKVLSDGVVVLPEYTGDTFESLTINTGDVLSGGGYSITATGVASVQLYPFVVSRHKDTYVDGDKVSDSGTYRCSRFRFFDCYDIVDPIDYVRIIKANGGQYQANPDVTLMGVKSLVRVSIDYEFGGDGLCLVRTNFMALEDCNIYLQYGLNIKAMNKELQGSHLELYVPKTKAIVYDSETGQRATESTPVSRRLTYDYSQPSAQLMNELVGKGDGGLWYTSEDYVGESAPERGIEFLVWGNHRLSLQHGYTFEQPVGGADRIDYAARPWRIRASDGGYTVYPQAYQSGSASWSGNLAKGESYGYTCFRRYHDEGGNASGVISIFPLEVGGTLYVYADFSAAGVYEVDIPSRYIGAEAEVLYKSATIDAFSVGNSVGTLLASGQGYCLIKLKAK